MTLNVGDVEYGEVAFEFMRRLHDDYQAETDEEKKQQLRHEAYVIHRIHEEFPGVVMHDDAADEGRKAA